jgi:hypothetical protein
MGGLINPAEFRKNGDHISFLAKSGLLSANQQSKHVVDDGGAENYS